MPIGLVEQQHRMRAGLHRLRDLCQMQRCSAIAASVAARQHKTGRCAARWADRAKDIAEQIVLSIGSGRDPDHSGVGARHEVASKGEELVRGRNL